MICDWHSWNSLEGVRKYLKRRTAEGYVLVTIVPTGKVDDTGMAVLAYYWKMK